MAKRRAPHPAVAADPTPGPPSQLESSLGYRFRDPALLRLALTHRSFPYEVRSADSLPVQPAEGKNPPGSDNEQLEFLGDAVLGLAITDLLYSHFPACSEGELTRLRAHLVSRDSLAAMGVALGLGQLLLLGNSAESNHGRGKPSLLADAAEAVLAALYLDARSAGEDGLRLVRALAQRLLLDPAAGELRQALARDRNRGALRDFKTLLQERVQAQNAGKLLYIDVAEAGPAHDRRFTVEARLETATGTLPLGSAEGRSKKDAQQRAAEGALASWDQHLPAPSPPGPAPQSSLKSGLQPSPQPSPRADPA